MVHLLYADQSIKHYQPKEVQCRQSWNNEAKNRPIDIPRVARSLPSATGRTTLGQEGAIIFYRANIDLPGKHSPAER